MRDALWVVQLVVRNAACKGMQSASRRLPLSRCLLDCLARHREHHRAVALPVPVVVLVVVLLRLNSNRLLMPTILTNVDVGVGQTSIDARGVQKQKPKQTTAATTIKGRQGLEIDMYVYKCVRVCMYS